MHDDGLARLQLKRQDLAGEIRAERRLARRALGSEINNEAVAPETARFNMPPNPPAEVVFMLAVAVIHDIAPVSENTV